MSHALAGYDPALRCAHCVPTCRCALLCVRHEHACADQPCMFMSHALARLRRDAEVRRCTPPLPARPPPRLEPRLDPRDTQLAADREEVAACMQPADAAALRQRGDARFRCAAAVPVPKGLGGWMGRTRSCRPLSPPCCTLRCAVSVSHRYAVAGQGKGRVRCPSRKPRQPFGNHLAQWHCRMSLPYAHALASGVGALVVRNCYM